MKHLRILIVDDEPDISKFMRIKLSIEAPDYNIATLESARECLSYINEHPIDCIISDFQMPEMSGMDLLTRLRADGSDIPFIFMTGQGNEELAREAFKNGANDYFTKEIGFAHFARIINSVEQAVRQRAAVIAKKTAEDRLQLLEEAVEALPIGITITDKSGCIVYTNPAEAAMHGYDVSEMDGMEARRLAPAGDGSPLEFEEIKKLGAWVREAENIRKDGKTFDVQLTSIAVTDDTGNPVGIVTACEDISKRARAEKAVIDERNKLQAVLASIGDEVCIIDTGFRLLFQNDADMNFHGGHVGESCFHAYEGREFPCGDCPMVPAFKEGVTHRSERIVRGEAGSRSFDITASPVRDSSGAIIGGVKVMKDMTARKKVEEAYRESERRFREMIENVQLAAIALDTDGRITYSNRYAQQLTGFTLDETIGMKAFDNFIPEAYRDKVIRDFFVFVKDDTFPVSYELPIMTRTGGIRMMSWSTTLMRDDDGQLSGAMFVGKDTTDANLALDSLRISEERHRLIVETSDEGICVLDREGCIVFANGKLADMLGYTQSELLGMAAVDTVYEQDRDKARLYLERRRRGEKDRYDVRMLRHDGSNIWTMISASPIMDDDGTHQGSLAMFTDITDRKATEDALKRSEEKYRDMFENAEDAIFVVGPDLHYQDVNKRAVERFGYTREEFLSMSILDLVPPEQLPRSNEAFGKLRESGSYDCFSGKLRHKDGRWLDIEVSSSAIYENGEFMGSRDIVRDVSGRRRMEEQVREEHEFRKAIEESMAAGVIAADLEGRHTYANKAFCEMVGMTEEEINGTFPPFPYWPTDELDKVTNTYRNDSRGEIPPEGWELRFMHKDGSLFDVMLKSAPLLDSKGEKTGMLAVVYNITERKRLERALTESHRRLTDAETTARLGNWEWIIEDNGIFWSEGLCSILGVEFENRLRSHSEFLDKLHPDDRPIVKRIDEEVWAGKRYDEHELRIITPDGKTRVAIAHLEASFGDDGQPVRLFGTMQDITERRRMEDELIKSETAFAEAERVAGLGHYYWDIKKDEVSWSEGQFSIFGIEPRTPFGSRADFYELIHPDDREKLLLTVNSAMEDKISVKTGARAVLGDGTEKFIEIHVVTDYDAAGEVERMHGTVQDITDRKRMEEELIKSQERYADAELVANFGHWEWHVGHDEIDWSDGLFRIFGMNPEGRFGRYGNYLDMVHPDDLDMVKKNVADCLAGKPLKYDARIITKDGKEKWIGAHGRTVFDDSGAPVSMFGTVNDITDRKRIEDELQAAYDEVSVRQSEIIALLDSSKVMLGPNNYMDAVKAIFHSCKKLIGAGGGYIARLSKDGSYNDVILLDSGGTPCNVDPELPMPIRGLREEAYKSGKPIINNDFYGSDYYGLLPEGHMRLENVMFTPLVVAGMVSGVMGLANKPGGFTEHDATMATAFAEFVAVAVYNSDILESIQENEEHFRSVAETANDAVISFDSTGGIILWNKAAERLFGYTAHDAVGLPISMIMPETSKTAFENEIIRTAITREYGEGRSPVEIIAVTKDNTELPVELSLAAWKTGNRSFFTAIVRDASERKRLEGQKADFYAMVTHDLKSPLMAVLGYADLITAQYERDEELIDMADGIRRSGLKIVRIIEDFLTISKLETGGMTLNEAPVDVSEMMISLMDEFIPFAVKKNIKLVNETEMTVPMAVLDKTYMQRAVSNLIQNAVNYTPYGGSIVIKAGLSEGEGSPLAISVKDSGPGIDTDEHDKVFHKYYRSQKTAGVKGTGLGLAIVKAVAESHAGKVTLESVPGNGCVFTILLPENRLL